FLRRPCDAEEQAKRNDYEKTDRIIGSPDGGSRRNHRRQSTAFSAIRKRQTRFAQFASNQSPHLEEELVALLWLGADSGFLSLGYQYCKWHFSQVSSMPLPTSRSLAASFSSIALNASIVASCKP